MSDIRYRECSSGRYIDNMDGTYTCPQCDFSCDSTMGMAAHMVRHQDLHLVCSECGREFRNRRALGRHIGSSHTRHDPVECDVCGETFMNKRALGNHKTETHDYLVSRTCEICGRACSGWASYQNHVKAVHLGGYTYTKERGGGTGNRCGADPHLFSVLKRLWWITATDDERRLLSESCHTISADNKRRDNVIRRWGEKAVGDIVEIQQKIVDSRSRSKYCVMNRSGDRVLCDSLLEAGLCEAMLIDNAISDFRRCHDVIPIIGMRATYNPDFTVDLSDGSVVVIEVKGRAGWNEEQLRRLPFKTESAIAYYSDRGVSYRLLFGGDIEEYRVALGLSRRASVDSNHIADNRL